MGSECSTCSKCQIGLSEKQNEINRQSIEYPNGKYKNEEVLENKFLNSENKNKIIQYYSNDIGKIIFLQLKIKKFLYKLKPDSNPQNRFYNKNYGTYELSNDNLDIISEKNDNYAEDHSHKEEKHHQLKASNEKFKTLSQKYSTINNNESIGNNKLYKVEQYPMNE